MALFRRISDFMSLKKLKFKIRFLDLNIKYLTLSEWHPFVNNSRNPIIKEYSQKKKRNLEDFKLPVYQNH
jgi:hypothetical protein